MGMGLEDASAAGVEHENREPANPTGTTQRRNITRPSKSHNTFLRSTALKSINHFARRHKFFTEQSFGRYATSQRRAFERDVYDYARSISLSKAQAKASIVHARSLCGEEDYDSDNSRLDDDEVDDSSTRLANLRASTHCCSQPQQAPSSIDPEKPSSSSATVVGNTKKRRNDGSDNPSGKKQKAMDNIAKGSMLSSLTPRESQDHISATASAAGPHQVPPLPGSDNEPHHKPSDHLSHHSRVLMINQESAKDQSPLQIAALAVPGTSHARRQRVCGDEHGGRQAANQADNNGTHGPPQARLEHGSVTVHESPVIAGSDAEPATAKPHANLPSPGSGENGKTRFSCTVDNLGETRARARETKGPFERYSNISNAWQPTISDDHPQVQSQADVTMHDQSEASDANHNSRPGFDGTSHSSSKLSSDSGSHSDSNRTAEGKQAVKVADSVEEVKVEGEAADSTDAESDGDESSEESKQRGKVGKSLNREQPVESDSAEDSYTSGEDAVKEKNAAPVGEDGSNDSDESDADTESGSEEDSEDSDDAESENSPETGHGPEKTTVVRNWRVGASAAGASIGPPPVNPLQCCICQRVYETKGPAHDNTARRRERREQPEANGSKKERDAEFERTTHSLGGFSKSDDSESIMATDEDILDKAFAVQTLGLRGGAAVKVSNAASSSDGGSSTTGSEDESTIISTSAVDDEIAHKSDDALEYRGLDPSRIMAMVDVLRKIKNAFSEYTTDSNPPSPLATRRSTPTKIPVSSASSSPLSSAPSSPAWPSPNGNGENEPGEQELGEKQQEPLTPSRKRPPSSTTSRYFVPPPKVAKEAVSCIPFPAFSSTSFGLVQESLASNPFHLLIAVIFLNKTRGSVAMPVFYTFITRFPEPASLAAADLAEVVGFFQNLGLQNQRAKKCIALAKAWLQQPPAKGKRWRRLHYPAFGDGKDIKGNEEPIADETEDTRVGWEVGHMPGIGAYGIDSWRIFCRDELRGLNTAELPDLLPDATEEKKAKVEEEEMKREWSRVLPLDKELRAYLRWRWLRLGWEWDPKTGAKRRAEAGVIQEASGGGVICEGDQGWTMNWSEDEYYGAYRPSAPRPPHIRYSFEPPKVSDPLAPYALPIAAPPVRGSQYRRPYRREDYVDKYNLEKEHYNHQSPRRHRHKHSSDHHFSEDSWDGHAPLSDASIDSYLSGALSEDSFTFDASTSDSGKAQTYSMTAESWDPFQSVDTDDKKPPKPSPYTSLGPTVSRSRFVGDPLARWSCTAELSVPAASKITRKNEQPLFQWVHLQAQHQNLSSFTDHISMLTLTKTSEADNAAALMHQIRHRDEHSLPTREGRYLESGLTTWYPSIKGFVGKDAASRIHFLCMPYFSLSPYVGDKYVTTADSHALRSLLQTLYPSASMERDMLQAVCQLQVTELLVTSSQFSLYETQQGIVKANINESTQDLLDSPSLYVSDRSNRTWMIPITQCSTWLDFIAYFSTLTRDFESDFSISHRGVIQRPEAWEKLIALAAKQTVRLVLRSRCSGKSVAKERYFSPSDEEESLEEETDRARQTRSQGRSSSPTVAGSTSKEESTPADPDSRYHKTETAQFDFTETEETRPQKKKSSPRTRFQEISDKDFHLFHWLNAAPTSSIKEDVCGTRKEGEHKSKGDVDFTLDTQGLEQKVSQLQSYLKTKNRVGHRAYIQCPLHNLDDVEARKVEIVRMTKEREKLTRAKERHDIESELRRAKSYSKRREGREVRSNSISESSTSPGLYRDRRSPSGSSKITDTDLPDPKRAKALVGISKQLFMFFFPLAYSSRMTKKYWGAIHWLLHHEQACNGFHYEYRDLVIRIRAVMQPLARALRLGPPPGVVELPIEFTRAWIHLLTFWVLLTAEAPSPSPEAESSKCLRMLENARFKVFQMRVSSPLHTFEVALPPGIVSLVVNKLVGSVATGAPDIEATYYAYVTKLEQEVQQTPYNRGHQEKISSVRQEISCVLAVLEDQDSCVSKLRSTLIKGKLDTPPGFPQRREAYVLQQCLASISDKMQNFRALDERARGIAAFNLYRIESNRDRQEGAILVFTIVTIIFLPLSFVSSFFGMNVADIREMGTQQWVFWASAVPLTTLVLGISFFVARKIEPLKDWWQSVAGHWKTKPVPGGWYPAPAGVQPGRGHPGRVGTGRAGTGLRERRNDGWRRS
ncbi:MAG: hypothetical protein Q9185_005814 [Variospora sp. 1 TL-2023]